MWILRCVQPAWQLEDETEIILLNIIVDENDALGKKFTCQWKCLGDLKKIMDAVRITSVVGSLKSGNPPARFDEASSFVS